MLRFGICSPPGWLSSQKAHWPDGQTQVFPHIRQHARLPTQAEIEPQMTPRQLLDCAVVALLAGLASHAVDATERSIFRLRVTPIDAVGRVGAPVRLWLAIKNDSNREVMIADAGKNAIEMVRCPDGTGYGSTTFESTHTFPEGITQRLVHCLPPGQTYYFFHQIVPQCAGDLAVTSSARVFWAAGRDANLFVDERVEWTRTTIRMRVDESK